MSLIYDFGMHIADDTEYYLKKGFRVVAIEADPALCRAACERFTEEVRSGDLVIVNKAIGTHDGVFDFYVCNERSALSTAKLEYVESESRKNGLTFQKVPVQFTTADQILAEYGPARYAKIDIEGFDVLCLEQMARGNVRLDFISFELGGNDYNQALNACGKMGFKRFALVGQGPIAGRQAPISSREGQTISHTFTMGMSGPFGDDLDVEWRTDRQIKRDCAGLRAQMKLTGLMRKLGAGDVAAKILPAPQTWYDIHGKREFL